MSPKMVILILRALYPLVLRPLVQNAVNDPDSDWDEMLLTMLDSMLGS